MCAFYYYYYKRQIYPAVSEASRTGYKNYNVNTQTGPRKGDTITNYMRHWTDGFLDVSLELAVS